MWGSGFFLVTSNVAASDENLNYLNYKDALRSCNGRPMLLHHTVFHIDPDLNSALFPWLT